MIGPLTVVTLPLTLKVRLLPNPPRSMTEARIRFVPPPVLMFGPISVLVSVRSAPIAESAPPLNVTGPLPSGLSVPRPTKPELIVVPPR